MFMMMGMIMLVIVIMLMIVSMIMMVMMAMAELHGQFAVFATIAFHHGVMGMWVFPGQLQYALIE